MRIFKAVIAGGLLVFSHIALAATANNVYFYNPYINNPMTIHYKACHDADPNCTSSKMIDATIPANAYITVEIPPTEKEIKVYALEAFGTAFKFQSGTECGINPLTQLNAEVLETKLENNGLACTKFYYQSS